MSKRTPSPALVIAVLALFVGLSGTAVAAGIVPLAKRALTADKAKVADNARRLGGKTPAQIAAKMRGPRGVPGPAGVKGDTGPAGAQGPAGPQGAKGPAGPAGDQGDKGDTGDGIHLSGAVASVDDLPDTGEPGDAYMIGTNLYVWNGTGWVNSGAVKGPAGDKGDKGDTGPAGPTGARGPTGPAGPASTAASLVVRHTSPFSLGPQDADLFTVNCGAGEQAVSGGFTYQSDALVLSADSVATDDGTGWELFIMNFDDSLSVDGTLQVTCIK